MFLKAIKKNKREFPCCFGEGEVINVKFSLILSGRLATLCDYLGDLFPLGRLSSG